MQRSTVVLSAVLIVILLQTTATYAGSSTAADITNAATLPVVGQSTATTTVQTAINQETSTTQPAETTATTFVPCGTRSSNIGNIGPNIIGGSSSQPGAWPWQALVVVGTSTSSYGGFGGTLLNQQWVLTTASAVLAAGNSATLRVRLGSVSPIVSAADLISVDQSYTHPSYSSTTKQNDLALLHLASPVTYNDYIRPICLPPTNDDITRYISCYTTGYGGMTSSDTTLHSLQHVPVTPLQASVCSNFADAVFSFASQLCFGSSTAAGDYGGPVQCRDASANTWTLVGVSSYANTLHTVAIATRVMAYNDWIQQYIIWPTGPTVLTSTISSTTTAAASTTATGLLWKLPLVILLAVVAM